MNDAISIPAFPGKAEVVGSSSRFHMHIVPSIEDLFPGQTWKIEELTNITPEIVPLDQVRARFPGYQPFKPQGSFWVHYLAKRERCICLGAPFALLYHNDPRLVEICKEHHLEHVIFAGTVLRARHQRDSVPMLSIGKKGAITPSLLPVNDLTKFANREKYPKYGVIAHSLGT